MTSITGNASEFITFSRTSNATVTDSDGKIKWAPHNLLLASEQFDAASWLKTNAGSTTPTVTANAAVAPNGTTTAETVALGAIDAAGDSSVVYQTFTAVDATYRGGVYVKAATGGDVGKKVWMFMYDSAYRGVASVTLTTEWQLLSSTATLTAGANREFYIATIGSTNGGENQGAVSVHLWGAHLYRSDMGMQANTSAYPMYNPTTPKNLLGFSEDFSNAAWSKPSVTVTVNSVLAPNGLQTADLLTENTVNAGHWAFQSITTIASPLTASAYFKAGSRTWAFIRITDSGSVNRHVWFDLSSGSVGTTETGITASIVSVGDGWYRCRATIAAALAGSNSIVFAMSTGNGVSSYTGDGTSGIYLWGAQLSDSASLDTYSPVYGAAVTSAAYYGPRRDFDSAGVCRGLLVEELRTNLALQSAAFDVGWTPINLLAFGSGSVANAIASPDGTVTADLIVPDTTSGQHGVFRTVTTVSGTAYTSSVYAKAGGYNWLYMTEANNVTAQASFNISTGVLGTVSGTGSPSATITAVGNGWYRCTLTFTPISTSSNIQLRANSADGGAAFTGNGTSGVYLYGAQLELGSFATSYIPTTTASATRNADVASVSTQAFPYSATEGTLVANFTPTNVAAARRALQLDDITENERITLGTNSTPNGLLTVIDSGSSQASIATGTPAANTTMKLAARFKVNDFAVSANGAAVGTDTSGTLPTMNTLRLGSGTSSTEPLNGWLRQVTYLPRALTDAELVTRST